MELFAIKPMGVLGRIGIPNELRDRLGIDDGSLVGMYISGDSIILRAYPAGPVIRCILCNCVDPVSKKITLIDNTTLCISCMERISDAIEKETRRPE